MSKVTPNPDASRIKIRAMRRADVGAVVTMIKLLAAYHGDICKTTRAFVLRHCFGQARTIRVYVATDKNAIVGFAQTFDQAKLHRTLVDAKLDLLFVKEQWRNRSIGALLTAYAAQAALARGCVRFLTSSAAGNSKVENFYLGLGFIQRDSKSIDYLIEGKALHQLAKKNIHDKFKK